MQASRRTRLGRCGPRALLTATLVLVLAGCDLTTTRTLAPDSSAGLLPSGPTLPSSTVVPFSASAYPPDGPAPCAEAAPPDVDHAAYTGNLRRIRAEEPGIVVFELCRPDVAFRARLAHPSFGIADSGWLISQIDPAPDSDPAIATVINGTGPFRFEVWNRGSDLSFVRNEDYWAGTAVPERLVFTWSGASSERLTALVKGDVDGVDGLTAAELAVAIDMEDISVALRPGLSTLYLGMNDRYAPFDLDLVRRAIAIGIDRADVVERAFPFGTKVATHSSPCALEFGCVGPAWLQYDPVRGKELLAEAGLADGFSTTLRYPDEAREYLPDPEGTAIAIRDQLEANLGIVTTLEAVPFETLVGDAEAGRLDGLHLLGARPRITDVSAVLEPRFGAAASDEFGDQLDDVVAALEAGAATVDPEARAAAYAQANRTLRLLAPAVPIAHPGSAAAFLVDVLDAVASPTGTERFDEMTPGDRRQLVWLQATEPGSLFCADETDPDALRACAQASEGLYGYATGSATVEPRLATACEPDGALSTWTCTIRGDVRFHDGATLDASDVVSTFALQWDADHPRHRGRTGTFGTFERLFGGFLHPAAAPPG